MKGWKFIFLPDLPVPAELPVEINSFKAQQCRWAKGAMQTGKTLPRIPGAISSCRETRGLVPPRATSYPLMVVLTSALPGDDRPVQPGWLNCDHRPAAVHAFFCATTFYLTSQKILRRLVQTDCIFPGLMAQNRYDDLAQSGPEGALGIRSPCPYAHE
jgi:hypothetical protein